MHHATRRFIPRSRQAIAILLLGFTLLTACTANSGTSPTSAEFPKIILTTQPTPPQIGDGQLVIDIVGTEGQPIDDVKVDISMGMSSMSMNTQDGQATGQGKGRFVRAVTFHLKGEYTVRIWVRRSGELLKTEDFRFAIG